MPLGPLEVMIVNFEDADFTGEIEAELVRLEDTGVLRVLDLLIVGKTADGVIEAIRTDNVHDGAMSKALLGITDGAPLDDEDVRSTAEAIAPGGAAAVAVLEHRWAIGLRESIARAGGTNVVNQWAEPEDLAALGVALPSA